MSELRPYQVEGVNWLLEHEYAILADEPGVGKTPQIVSMLAARNPRNVLIVAPKSAIGVWQDELETWWPEADPQVFGGPRRGPSQLIGNVAITNYALMRDVLKLRRHWNTIVFDEAHVLRNRQTATLFKTAKHFSAVHMYHVTGTPIVKNAGDLWPLLNMLSHDYKSYWRFVNEYCEVANNGFGWNVSGVKNETALWEALEGILLRRKKADVLPELPEKTRQRVPLRMTSTQARHYKSIALEMFTELEDGSMLLTPGVLAQEMRLRQLLVSPRLLGIADEGAIIPALREFASGMQEPLVVFTPFTEAIPLLQDALGDVGYVTAPLYGGMTDTRITGTWQQFQASSNPQRAIVASIEMSVGWNAWTASQCFFAGFAWSPHIHTQAEDRLHRFGQHSPVLARYFSHVNTVDMHQLDILSGKTDIAKLVLDRHNFLP